MTGRTYGDGLGGSRSGVICVRFQKESVASSLRSSHLLDISNDRALRTIMSNCITKENGNLLAY